MYILDRRLSVTGTGTIYGFGPYRLDREQRLLLRGDEPVPLAPKAVLILCLLVENHGRLLERTEIMQRVWPDAFVEEGNLTVHIFALRKMLAEGLGEAPAIQTVPKRGYRFVAEVQEICAQAAGVMAPAPAHSRAPLRKLPALAGLSLAAAVALWAVLPPAFPKVSRVDQLTRFGLAESLASDGARLFAGQKKGGMHSIVEIPADGGEPKPFPLPFANARLLDVSPVRQEMLVAAYERAGDPLFVWIVPIGDGKRRQLGRIQASSARWSPDGARIAYAFESGLFVVARDGSGVRKIAEPGGTVDAWSPDGQTIRFTRTNQATGGQSMWEVQADGSGLRPLLPGRQMANARWGEGQCCGKWSPDGRYFFFREAIGSTSALWTVPERHALRSGAPARLYAASFAVSDAAITPDGKRLLLLGLNETHEVVRFDRGLSQWVPIAVDPTAIDVHWSRDGQSISYVSAPEHSLWVARADGSARLRLTTPPVQAFAHWWSPDGRLLAFHLLAPGKPGKIGVVAATGGKPEILFAGAPTGEDCPSWSADASHLFFERYWLDQDGNTTANAMCEIDLKAGQVTQLPGTGNLGPPAVSPDGRYIAAQAADFHSLMLYDFQSGKWTGIAHGGFIHNPEWTRDSRSIVFQDPAGGEEQPVYQVSLPDLAVKKIAGRRQFLRADVSRFSLSGLTPAGDPVATVIHGNSDIYALSLAR